MTRFYRIALAVLALLLLPGCYDQMNLEDASISLMIGLDMDADNNLVISSQSPVFYKEAREKTESITVKSNSIRASRNKFDSILTGITTGGKLQTVLIGKRLLEQQNWFSLLDLYYRVPKLTETPRIVVVDGEVKDIFEFKPADKPRLSLHIRKLIDTAHMTNNTVVTHLQEFRRQMKDKGMTASLTYLKKEQNDVVVTGTALLNKRGKLMEHFSIMESTMFLVMQRQNPRGASLILNLDEPQEDQAVPDDQRGIRNEISFDIVNFKKKVKTAYSNGKFRFDVGLKMSVIITSIQSDNKEFAKQSQIQFQEKIQANLERQFDSIVERCQKKAIDPFGFGRYARAYQYKAWKPVQDEWGQTFANADVRMHIKVNIKNYGVTDLYSPLDGQ
ncbi:Ger(x)C family spore germination protein [Paenibacillus montanisoli]|uniref:Ger(X)C family spore germination protein n=1 Tax=Paenibacillus montanisoli TaxID=2081970 RepID=A0A328U8R5_9BACL|nr:Ger(x)C family spore germination protein [Paenibacillus montanisoli]RAP77761.1 Ger(x)C family spore germination protein [Paenibacillus montanisoli]